MMHLALGLTLVLASLATARAQPAAPGPTLAMVRAKGVLDCSSAQGSPGFGTIDSTGTYRGLDADSCRAVAAAIFGNPDKIRWHVVTSSTRLPSLQSGQVDVLARTVTWTQSRDTTNGLNFAAVNFYDGQGFLVRTASGVKRARELDGATICTTSGSTSELNLVDWARSNNLTLHFVVFEQPIEARNAYEAGRCDSYSTDASQLAGVRTGMPKPEEHAVLPDIISKEPLALGVRHGDDQWLDIVRWSIYAMIEAEELGVTQANVEQQLESDNPAVRRLLGTAGDHGPMMGLDRRWAYNIIHAIGNYGEMFDRNVGATSPLKLARGINDLWSRGGLMYAPPIR